MQGPRITASNRCYLEFHQWQQVPSVSGLSAFGSCFEQRPRLEDRSSSLGRCMLCDCCLHTKAEAACWADQDLAAEPSVVAAVSRFDLG